MNRLSANHCAAPITAPAIRPPASATPTASTGPKTTFAINPPIGKPTRIATGHAQTGGRASVAGVSAGDVVCDKASMVSFPLLVGARRCRLRALRRCPGGRVSWLGSGRVVRLVEAVSFDVDLRDPVQPGGEIPVVLAEQLHACRNENGADDRGV